MILGSRVQHRKSVKAWLLSTSGNRYHSKLAAHPSIMTHKGRKHILLLPSLVQTFGRICSHCEHNIHIRGERPFFDFLRPHTFCHSDDVAKGSSFCSTRKRPSHRRRYHTRQHINSAAQRTKTHKSFTPNKQTNKETGRQTKRCAE